MGSLRSSHDWEHLPMPKRCRCGRGLAWSAATKNVYKRLEITGFHGKDKNVFLPSHTHTPTETKMKQGKKVEGVEVVRDVGAHVLPRGEGGRVVVVSYIHVFHSYYKGKYRVVIVRRKKKLREVGLWSWSHGQQHCSGPGQDDPKYRHQGRRCGHAGLKGHNRR